MADSNEPHSPVVGEHGSEAKDGNTLCLALTTTAPQRTAARHEIRALIMAELNRHRMAMKFAQEPFGELAGLPDRYFSKALNAHEYSGREPTWPLLQAMVSTIFPDGVTVVFTAVPGPLRKQMIARYRATVRHQHL